MQSYELSKVEDSEKSVAQLELNHTWAFRVQLLDHGIIFKIWQTITLQSFNLQRITTPLLKDFNLLIMHIINQRTSRIRKIGFSLCC